MVVRQQDVARELDIAVATEVGSLRNSDIRSITSLD